ncbi:Bug family tripartite tricarboxylate transporter substrate binding protein [Cupriavidus necator]|uniref:Bug family tripartite tricarboxylate transporter substrate binding protein n=1 Tax=Cupriavidus necator TaxID=106590 RepID=UPI003F501AD6
MTRLPGGVVRFAVGLQEPDRSGRPPGWATTNEVEEKTMHSKLFSFALRRAKLALLLAATLLAANAALAEPAWPERPVTIIVPGAPGGTIDIPTRLVAQKLAGLLGQPVIVDNRPGSGGIIGVQALLRAPADGYTLVAGNTGSHAINYSAYKQLPYRPAEFIPLTDLIVFPNVLVVNAQSSIRTVADLIAQLKSRPGQLSFASAGIGQTTHLSGEMFGMRTGTNAIHVPYRGSVPATTSLVAGETTFMFDNLTQSLPHVRAGKLRALAVTSAERLSSLPDVPTMAQAGVNDFVVTGWAGFFVSAKTPPSIVTRLQDSLIKAMHDPEVVVKIKEMGSIPGGQPQPKFAAFVNSEQRLWGQIVRHSNLSLD